MGEVVPEMVERVARALSDRVYDCHCGGADAETHVPGKANWTFCVRHARVLIESFREPTEQMIVAGALELRSFGMPRHTAAKVWSEMLAEALR